MMRENEDAAFWATAKSSDAGPGFAKMERSDTGLSLQTQMALQTLGPSDGPARWVAPSARDWKDTPGMDMEGRDGRRRDDQLPRQMSATEVGGQITVGSSATTKKPGGSPNPAFPCWLQGYPAVWLFCAPVKLSRPKKSPKRKRSAG